MSKAKSGRKLRLFLCSDVLVLTDEVGGGLYRVVSVSFSNTGFSQVLTRATAHASQRSTNKRAGNRARFVTFLPITTLNLLLVVDDALLRLHLAYPRGGDTIILRAASIKESLAWKEAIVRASRRAKEGERRAAKARHVTPRADL